MEGEFFKTRGAARYLGMSPDKLTKELKKPDFDLPFINCGSYRLFRKADLDSWIKRHTVTNASARRRNESPTKECC